METFIIMLVMLSLIGLSNVLHRFVPFVPIPLIQISLGIFLAILPVQVHLPLDPELFFVLFIAPLLFNDGRRIPRGELWKLRAPILFLALGLVFTTVLVLGYSIRWLIPSISLPAAFALAAILSPTDAVAVSGLAGRIHLPKSIRRVLEGESLMNDASGLVAFKFAISAAVTGVFSLAQASFSFLVIAIGGMLMGAVLAFLIIRLGVFIRRLGMEDETIHMLLQILTPFVIYLVSEELGVSGILAVVAAGVIHAIEKDRSVSPHYRLQLVSASTWSVLLFILNGLVFVILGFTVPDVMNVIFRNEAFNNYIVIGYIVAITFLLIALRFIWIYLFTFINIIRNKGEQSSSIRVVLLTSLSGVRGAVTLAGAFSIPLFLSDGTPFPGRDLMIFLAAGVILLSLLIASILLPVLVDKKENSYAKNSGQIERAAREKVIEAGVQMLQTLMTDKTNTSVKSAISEFKENTNMLKREVEKGDSGSIKRQKETDIRILAIKAERKELARMLQAKETNFHIAEKLGDLLDHTEVILARRFDSQFRISLLEVRRFFSHLFSSDQQSEGDENGCFNINHLREAKIKTAQAAMEAIIKNRNKENHIASGLVLTRYRHVIKRLKESPNDPNRSEPLDEQRLELKIKAIQEQRDTVQEMFENGTITREIAAKLRRFVNDVEASLLKED